MTNAGPSEGVAALERLATAYWVSVNEEGDNDARATLINSLKPHISIERALEALQQVHDLQDRAPVIRA